MATVAAHQEECQPREDDRAGDDEGAEQADDGDRPQPGVMGGGAREVGEDHDTDELGGEERGLGEDQPGRVQAAVVPAEKIARDEGVHVAQDEEGEQGVGGKHRLVKH